MHVVHSLPRVSDHIMNARRLTVSQTGAYKNETHPEQLICLLFVCVFVCEGGGCVCAFRIALLNGIVELHHKSVPHQGDKMKRAPRHKTSVTVPSATNT